ncbi:TerC family protein [Kouleothrix sp.]|uniref:TerC family protein n=1 Tax=Kouleothrix sp. TaxID=2779161 RepID=UPI00391BF11B
MDVGIITIIAQLIFLECILSIDNAAVIGAMVTKLPNDKRTPWPAMLQPILGRFDKLLGSQRESALKVGLFGAYAGRIVMLALASIIIKNPWMQILGALYLIYLALKHFVERFQHHQQQRRADDTSERPAKPQSFWQVVLTIELADLAFSLDNVVAAVSLSERLWVVVAGVAIGIVVIRFAATLFTRLIAWEPALEHAAYLLLVAIGGELILEHWLHVELNDLLKFAISLAVLALTVIVARVYGWVSANRAHEVKSDVR